MIKFEVGQKWNTTGGHVAEVVEVDWSYKAALLDHGEGRRFWHFMNASGKNDLHTVEHTLTTLATDTPKLEIGTTYTAKNGTRWKCIHIRDNGYAVVDNGVVTNTCRPDGADLSGYAPLDLIIGGRIVAGGKYTSDRGDKWECIAIRGNIAWLAGDYSDGLGTGYKFNINGTHISLSKEYDIDWSKQ